MVVQLGVQLRTDLTRAEPNLGTQMTAETITPPPPVLAGPLSPAASACISIFRPKGSDRQDNGKSGN